MSFHLSLKRARVTYLDQKGWCAHLIGWIRWDAAVRATFDIVEDDGQRHCVVGALVAVTPWHYRPNADPNLSGDGGVS